LARIFYSKLAREKKLKELTEIMEAKVGKKFVAEIKDKKGKLLGEQELEKYFIVHITDVLCVIN